MKSINNNFLYYFLLFSALVLIFGVFFNNSNTQTTNSTTTSIVETQKQEVINNPENLEYKNIYFFNKTEKSFNIYKYNGEKNQIIFTDSDEKEKIEKILGIDNNLLYVLMKDSSISNLYSIPLDLSGNKKLAIANFSKDNLALGKNKIAYSEYSNAERDFGYKIFTSSIDGSNKEEVVNESLSPLYMQINNNKLYYTINRSNLFEIYSVDLSNNDKTLIAELNTQPENLIILSSLLLYLTDNKIMSYDMTSKKSNQFISDTKIDNFIFYNQYILYSKNGKIIAKLKEKDLEITSGDHLILAE